MAGPGARRSPARLGFQDTWPADCAKVTFAFGCAGCGFICTWDDSGGRPWSPAREGGGRAARAGPTWLPCPSQPGPWEVMASEGPRVALTSREPPTHGRPVRGHFRLVDKPPAQGVHPSAPDGSLPSKHLAWGPHVLSVPLPRAGLRLPPGAPRTWPNSSQCPEHLARPPGPTVGRVRLRTSHTRARSSPGTLGVASVPSPSPQTATQASEPGPEATGTRGPRDGCRPQPPAVWCQGWGAQACRDPT